ncbi:DUF1801 domain-containing protein [Neptunicella sp.]|uniref:DUF1801 domain-containing protein n=1 Tax=Neptunicella sp. TaxID=2125986 RepID=UPI003F693E4F
MNEQVKTKFATYPAHIRPLMLNLRELILTVANELEIGEIVETLKWGEPSYIAQHGSTIRIDWKAKQPDQYALYFNCNSSLVETFKQRYGELFNYQGNRAIIFRLDDHIPTAPLQHCIQLSLQYHKVKHLPLLGV